jgi:hypothetical protein
VIPSEHHFQLELLLESQNNGEPRWGRINKIQGNKFTANVKCPTDILPEASVTIDVTNVNPQSVRTPEGARVDVIIDALGQEATTFLLKKKD